MRIISVSDLHGSIERLELLLEFTSADLYLLTGDLLYNPFDNLEELERYYLAQAEVRRWRGSSQASVPLFVRNIYGRLDTPRQAIARDYLHLSEVAERAMQRKYRQLERLTEIRPRTPFFFIPGNYDMDLRATALAPKQLHKRAADNDFGRLAGYGGAPVFTSGVPEHLAIQFREERRQRPGAYSEPYETLRQLDPDIAVVHVPPLGLQDGSPSRSFGSWGIREFLDQSQRCRLLVCGHVHTGWGVSRAGRCWVVNSGNFGQVVEGTGYRRGGYFAEIDYEPGEGVKSVVLKLLQHNKIWHLIDYSQGPDGRLREEIVDPKRVQQLRSRPVVASEAEASGTGDEMQSQALEHYNQVKLFLRRFETAASEQRIDDLREIVELARAKGTEIAFDLLGSVNMGQSTEHSDVDAVLYIADDPANNRYKPTFWPDIVQEVTGGRYELDFTDVIDLWEVRDAVAAGDDKNEALQRFVIYRTIGRPVNVRTLRKYDDLLLEAGDLRARIQRDLRKDIELMAGTYAQNKSFEKYMARLQEKGVRIPARIRARVHRYLHTIDDTSLWGAGEDEESEG